MDKSNKYNLYKQNNFLRLSRILFRYFNNVDLKKIKENFQIDYIINMDIKSIIREPENYTNNDRNALMNYSKVKSMSDETKKLKVDFTTREILDYKKKILSHSRFPIVESIIDSSSDLKIEDEEIFNDLASHLSEKLYEILDKNFSEDGSTILSIVGICNNIKYLIFSYLELKDQYFKTNPKMYDLINQEIVMQLFRHANRNDFTQESKIIQYTFGLFMILSFYLELNSNIINSLRKWLNFLISKNYYSDYCKNIQKNLINHSNTKILWVPSIFEIENRLENDPIMLQINYDLLNGEEFEINERTTVSDLFEKMMIESKFFKDISEKRLYWINIKHIKINEILPAFNEEYILDIISCLEENYLNNVDYLSQGHQSNVKNLRQKSEIQQTIPIRQSLYNSESNSEILIKKIERPQSFIFKHISFLTQRRIFTPIVISQEISNYLHQNEILILFEQIKCQYLKQGFSLIISDSKTILLSAILLEILKRNTNYFDSSLPLEHNIELNLQYVMPKFKKNSIMNNIDSFILSIKKIILEKNFAIKLEKELKEEFIKCLRNYEIFFSNIYEIKKSEINYSTYETISGFSYDLNLPDQFLIMVNLNYVLFLDKNKFEPLLKFYFHEIVNCTFIADTLYLTICINISNKNSTTSLELNKKLNSLNEKKQICTKEIRMKLITDEARVIMEDLLTLSQLSISMKTNSEFTNCTTIQNHNYTKEEFNLNILCDLKDYKLIYQRKLPFLNMVPSIAVDLNLINQNRKTSALMRSSVLKNDIINVYGKTVPELTRNASSQISLIKKEPSSGSLVSKKSKEGEVESNNHEKLNVNDRSEKIMYENRKDSPNHRSSANPLSNFGISTRNPSIKNRSNVKLPKISEEKEDTDRIVSNSENLDKKNSIKEQDIKKDSIVKIRTFKEKKPPESKAVENTNNKINKALNMLPPNILSIIKK